MSCMKYDLSYFISVFYISSIYLCIMLPGLSQRSRPRRDLWLGSRGLHHRERQDHRETRQDEDGLVCEDAGIV